MTTWSDIFRTSFYSMWAQVAIYFPKILGALVILIIGLIVSNVIGKVIARLIRFTRIDSLADQVMSNRWPNNPSLRFRFSELIGGVIKWFFYIITFIAVSDALQIPQLTQFLLQVTYYLPNVVVAIIIMAIGLIAGRFLYNAITVSANSMVGDPTAKILATIADWAVLVFAGMAALLQLGIAENLIQILFAGIIFMIALAGGLAFGLGGRDRANQLLEQVGTNAFKK